MLRIKIDPRKMQCSGTGPDSRQLQDEVGGVAPAGLFLDQTACCASRHCGDPRLTGCAAKLKRGSKQFANSPDLKSFGRERVGPPRQAEALPPIDRRLSERIDQCVIAVRRWRNAQRSAPPYCKYWSQEN
ncbi:hypothetical protein RX327_35300 [Bradyrhizobium sp. BEA-2-5]|uniref:hypothetical protein n=1 Tax=Bradyrhizobium TaxID=374 RepID=UPI00128F7D5E|nr:MULTISPECIES: hypothetical protein [Bradyrhizobium]WOH80949.1 hypothetical protein RX327_35300 [Bradyrhizobium sp. BEA-2-5]